MNVPQVLESCDGKRPSEVTIEVSHDVASTDTDSGMSGEERRPGVESEVPLVAEGGRHLYIIEQ